jgi:succinyl-CoA synthetase beta subunit
VKHGRSLDEAEHAAAQIIGMDARHPPDRPDGRSGARAVEEGLQIDRELYLSIVIDRAQARPVIIASAAGGMDIEEVAARTREDPARGSGSGTGIIPFQGRKLAFAWACRAAAPKLVKVLESIYRRSSNRRLDDRDQPAHRDRRRRLLALDAKVTSTTTRSTATRTQGAARPSEEDPLESRPRSSR